MYDQVLVPTDGSESAESGARHAVALASAFDATVHALAVIDTATAGLFETDLAYLDRLRERAESGVEAVASIGANRGVTVETTVTEGAPVRTILDHADRADLIAMGTHGRTGIERVALGSVTERVLRRAPVPVVTARADAVVPTGGYDAVLVPTDGSERAEQAVIHAVRVADAVGATVHALSVVDLQLLGWSGGEGGAPEIADVMQADAQSAVAAVAERAREAGVDATTRVTQGYPASEITQYVENAGIDLVTMGTTGRTGLNRVFLGSTTERVLRHAACPVMAVNARENAEPDGTE